MNRERLDMTKKELTALARKRGLKGYSTMTKAELESALGLDTMVFKGEETPEQTKGSKAKKPATPAKGAAKKPTTPAKSEAKKSSAPAESESEAAVTEESTALEAPTAATKLTKPDQPVVEKKVPAAEAEADDLATEAALVEGETEALEDEGAEVKEEPKGPILKQTWTKHELLIDEELPQALPGGYNRDRAVLMVRDPFWVYGYWDLSAETVLRARQEGGERLTLRVHDVTDVMFDGANSHYSFDIPMPFDGQRVWYFNVPTDGRTYLYQVGYLRSDKRFLPLITSNVASTPRSRMSDVIADRFVDIAYERPLEEATRPVLPVAPTPSPAEPGFVQERVSGEKPVADISAQMYQESLRGTPYWSADIPKYGDVRNARGLGSASLSSWGLPSSAQHAPKPEGKNKDFWLVADCELIVYGATEPDAKVTVRGQAIQLRPDGSFTLRFALPNGIHPIPIHAVNADEDMERGITITVSRDTQVDE